VFWHSFKDEILQITKFSSMAWCIITIKKAYNLTYVPLYEGFDTNMFHNMNAALATSLSLLPCIDRIRRENPSSFKNASSAGENALVRPERSITLTNQV